MIVKQWVLNLKILQALKANVGDLVLSLSSSFYDNHFWENLMSMVSNEQITCVFEISLNKYLCFYMFSLQIVFVIILVECLIMGNCETLNCCRGLYFQVWHDEVPFIVRERDLWIIQGSFWIKKRVKKMDKSNYFKFTRNKQRPQTLDEHWTCFN